MSPFFKLTTFAGEYGYTPAMSQPKLGDRSLFPTLESRAYLNHAAVSPPSLPVQSAAKSVIDDYAAKGVGAVFGWFEQRDRLRGKLAQLVGGEATDFALIPNTTRGVSDVALCMPWTSGDRVVVFEGEFPSNVTPWQCAAKTFDLELVWQPADRFRTDTTAALDALEAELKRGVKLVAVSFVQFQTGLRMPVEAIGQLCAKHGTELFVDGIQGTGVAPVNVRDAGIHYFSCGAQKWLMGLEGAAFLYVEPGAAKRLVPRVAGWLSHEDPLEFLFHGPGHLRYDRPIRREANFFEGGAMAAVSFAALEASVDLLLELGVDAIHHHVNTFHNRLEPTLQALGFNSVRSTDPKLRSGTLSVALKDEAQLNAVMEKLNAASVACTTPDGHLRFSPHWPNSLDEIPIIVDALR